MSAMPSKPRIAVVLPVFNGEKYIAEAVASVLAQTFRDFELAIVDDGSTDGTGEILSGIRDPRMRVVRFPENRGLVEALNAGIRETESELIARMDADDISQPRRFERQVAFLDAHPEVGICGGWMRKFGDDASLTSPPGGHEEIRAALFFCFGMAHPTVMMRRAVLDGHGLLYKDEFRYAEDLDLFIRAAEATRAANLREVLLMNRAHCEEVSAARERETIEATIRVLRPQLRLLMPGVTPQEEELHFRLLLGEADTESLASAEQWLLRLDRANLERGRYDSAAFRDHLRDVWLRVHLQARSGRLAAVASYSHSPLASIGETGLAAWAGKARRMGHVGLANGKRALRVAIGPYLPSGGPGSRGDGAAPGSHS